MRLFNFVGLALLGAAFAGLLHQRYDLAAAYGCIAAACLIQSRNDNVGAK